MDINYELIIEYLCKKDFKFSSKPKLSKPVDNFDMFKDFFRLGVSIYNDMNINICLMYSILYLLDINFIILTEEKKFDTITKILEEVKVCWNNFKEYDIPQLDGNQDILLYMNGKLENYINFYHILCKCLNINLLILDYKTNNISLYSRHKDKIDINYPLLILAKYNNFYEPVYNISNKIFNLNDQLFAPLISNYTIIKETLQIPKKSVLNKMKKKELLELCNKLNIKYKLKDTKNILIINIIKKKC